MKPENAIPCPTVLLFDLGDTLEHAGTALPHAAQALAVISGFRTPAGKPLPMALVSDYTMLGPDAEPEEIERIFREYIVYLRGTGLAAYFRPAEQCITLSTQAGVRKPERAVFDLALQRLGVPPGLEACVFVTENAAHVEACRKLGMHALRCGPMGDFDDWSAGPLVLARAFGIRDACALLLALDLRLHARYGFRLSRVAPLPPADDGRTRISATVDMDTDEPMPLGVTVTLDDSGDVAQVAVDGLPTDTSTEAQCYLELLEEQHRIAPSGADVPPGATHTLEPGPDGKMVLRRRKFSTS